MSSAKPMSRSSPLLPDWIPRHYVLPLFLSILAHALLLLFFASAMRWFERAPVGFSDEPTREIGIFVDRPGDHPESTFENEPNGGELSETAVQVASVSDPFAPREATSDKPPAETMLPTMEAVSNIGPGANIPAGPAISDPRATIKPGLGTQPAAPGARGGPRGAAFMGARDEGGTRIVFVIDASGSMSSCNAMQVAKGALLSSLQALDERQQFLLIFYDDKPRVVHLHNQTKPTLVPATDLNKTLAKQNIAGVQPGSGTDHVPPLKMALQMNPDVIFFLTDALEPPLYASDLEQLRKLNGGRARIHSIEFGQGPELEVDSGNFLRKLAQQNGGTYRYHDVMKFTGN